MYIDDRPLTLGLFEWLYLGGGLSDRLRICTTTMLCLQTLYITVNTCREIGDLFARGGIGS